MQFPTTRLRRLRQHEKLRDLIRETSLSICDLVMPIFIHHGTDIMNPIKSMPGLFQMSLDQLPKHINEIKQLGIPAVLLFGIPESKDATGSCSYKKDGIIQQGINIIKNQTPDLLVIADACFCEYTDHGHCGVIDYKQDQPYLHNDKTLARLSSQAISLAQAGADIIAPSGSIDGMVAHIREGLDQEGFEMLPIMSYSIKYASSFYGPFRDAAEGAPQFGDRKTYQMDPANTNEAIREIELDIAEGADILMVKPAGPYLDVIQRIKQQFPEMPLAAYQVSGEYSMIKAAAQQGWLDEKKVALESLLAIKRAGADMIINYFSMDVARWINQ